MNSFEHNTSTFIGKGGVEIFFQNWKKPSPDMILIISHGIGEHSGRYMNLVNELESLNLCIFAMDHRGHGKSGGKKGHCDDFMDYVYDLKLFRNYIAEEFDGVPIVLLGHSMGGVISMRYSLEYPDDIKALILSSPGFIPAFKLPSWKQSMSEFMGKYLPSFTLSNGLSAEDLSHDSSVIDAYENDPLVHDRASAGLYIGFTKTAAECMKRASELTIPLLAIHGKADMMVDYKGTEEVFLNVSSRSKKIILGEGMYHETMNETEELRSTILSSISEWLTSLVKPAGKKKAGPKAAAKKSSSKKASSKKAA